MMKINRICFSLNFPLRGCKSWLWGAFTVTTIYLRYRVIKYWSTSWRKRCASTIWGTCDIIEQARGPPMANDTRTQSDTQRFPRIIVTPTSRPLPSPREPDHHTDHVATLGSAPHHKTFSTSADSLSHIGWHVHRSWGPGHGPLWGHSLPYHNLQRPDKPPRAANIQSPLWNEWKTESAFS